MSQTWLPLDSLSTFHPLAGWMFSSFFFYHGSQASRDLLHFPLRLFTTAGLESSPSDKIKNLRLPDSIPQPILFSICWQMFWYCLPKAIGHLLVHVICQINSISMCLLHIICISLHCFLKPFWNCICLTLSHKSCPCAWLYETYSYACHVKHLTLSEQRMPSFYHQVGLC